jgi:hypothetical protein
MEAGRKHLLTLAAFAMALAIAVNIAMGLFKSSGDVVRGTDTRSAVLHIEPSALDFGDVAATDKFTWKIPVRNTLGRSVRIERFMTSCSCAGIEPATAELAPGETQRFLVKLDLFQGRTGEATYSFSESIYPVVSGEMGVNEPWVVRGQVHEVFRFEPDTVTFGAQTIVGGSPEAKVITAIPYELCEDVACRVVPDHAAVQVSRADDGVFRVHVLPRAIDTAGDQSFRLLITPQWSISVDKSLRRSLPRGERTIYVSYEVVAPVEAFPTYNHLGFVEIGQKREESCALRPRESGDIVVERFEVISSDTTVVSHDLLGTPHSEFDFRVACTPTSEGEQQASVRFHILHPNRNGTKESSARRAYSYDFHLHYRAQHNIAPSSNEPDLAEPQKANEEATRL